MPFFSRKLSKRDQAISARRRRRGDDLSRTSQFFETNQLIGCLLFLALAALIVIICFVGQAPFGPRINANQEAPFTAVAEFPFSYESRVHTQRQREQRRMQTPPVYRLDHRPIQQFQQQVDAFLLQLEHLDQQLSTASTQEQNRLIQQFIDTHAASSSLAIEPDDLLHLIQAVSNEERRHLFEEGLNILREIHRDGIVEDPILTRRSVMENDSLLLPSIEIIGRSGEIDIKDEVEANRYLSLHMRALDAASQTLAAITRVLRTGIVANLKYDPQESERRQQVAASELKPVVISVQAGHSIFESGTTVSAEQAEQYLAYQTELRQRETATIGLSPAMGLRIVQTFGILLAAVVYLRLVQPGLLASNHKMALTALLLLLNLTLIRLLLYVGDTGLISSSPTLTALLPTAAPIALGALILTVMIGAHPAIVLASLVSVFYALMVGKSLEVLLSVFLASLAAIYFCRDVRLRGKLVRAGAMSGITFAIYICFYGLLTEVPPLLVIQQMLVAFVTGIITATIAIGLLPLLENLFKLTTDITLLELTDFNHPLLRKMQMVAPGSYHHSLMVANLAERAAVEIGANPLLCRTSALFHDIGKMVKPEYFIENQAGGLNPHNQKNPSMSALVIKAHVKEGVEMARSAKLPKVLIDVIRQHHGTSLISYFYNKAVQQASQTTLMLTPGNSTAGLQAEGVDENTFRYDGPRPRFKESGIVFFADAIEAASRSLRKVTPHSVEELVDTIMWERIDDHQLDECPLTIQEINRISKSFTFTLLNMLHSRVEYPKKEKPAHPNLDASQ